MTEKDSRLVFKGKEVSIVRMKYRFSDVHSDKNSLAIIYICFKMHCLKYVEIVILFLFYSVHMAQVWLSNVPPCPSPLSQLTILISS